MGQSISQTIGLTANAASSGQAVRIDHATVVGMTIQNISSQTIQYTVNGGSSWTNITAGSSATPTVSDASKFRLRKSASDSYPVPVTLTWTGSNDANQNAYTVATLPSAGELGRRAFVTDATAPTFLGTLTGGGSVKCPVFDNGSAWVAG
jgi:hypothetical protein